MKLKAGQKAKFIGLNPDSIRIGLVVSYCDENPEFNDNQNEFERWITNNKYNVVSVIDSKGNIFVCWLDYHNKVVTEVIPGVFKADITKSEGYEIYSKDIFSRMFTWNDRLNKYISYVDKHMISLKLCERHTLKN